MYCKSVVIVGKEDSNSVNRHLGKIQTQWAGTLASKMSLGKLRSPAVAEQALITYCSSLQAFSNEVQFSCKKLTNQISQNSRLNWITLENASALAGEM